MNYKLNTLIVALTMLSASVFAGPPVFVLDWSEYPSWSAIEVASVYDHIDGKKGKQGPLEKKWNVDIVLSLKDYDGCLQAYSAFQSDATCLTNIDALNPALSRKSVAILPTSTSHGGDACIVDNSVSSIADLKNIDVFGLEGTVSDYAFASILQVNGQNPDDFNFTNMDPAAAASAMQQKQNGYKAIMVWNPFIVNTLAKRKDVKVLFSSDSIPGEIIDMVVIAESSLKKEGGDRFACAIAEAFYAVCNQLEDGNSLKDETTTAIGEQFSNLGLQHMRTVLKQTLFYETPAEGIALFESAELPKTMEKVVGIWKERGHIDEDVAISYGSESSDANLRFDSSFMQKVASQQ